MFQKKKSNSVEGIKKRNILVTFDKVCTYMFQYVKITRHKGKNVHSTNRSNVPEIRTHILYHDTIGVTTKTALFLLLPCTYTHIHTIEAVLR